MSFDASNETGGASVETGAQAPSGIGSITQITSIGASVTITNPFGPVVNLEVAGGGFPGYGGAPPAVALASAAGGNATVSRSDHTHAFTFPIYNPSIVQLQATGVLQQTYAAPTATPSALTMVAGQIPFGLAGGLLTQSAGLNYVETATNGQLNVQGANSAQLRLIENTTAGTSSQLVFRSGPLASNYFILSATPGAPAGQNAARFLMIPLAGGNGLDKIDFISSLVSQSLFGMYIAPALLDFWCGSPVTIAAAGTGGFLWIPQLAGRATGIPAAQAGVVNQRNAVAIDSTDHALYEWDGAAWHFVTFDDYNPTSTRIPFGSATAHATTDSDTLSFTVTATHGLLTVGTTTVAHDGAVLVNSGTNGVSIGGGATAGIVVADPNAAGAASVAVDDGYFGQWVVGYTALNLTTLNLGVGGANNFLNLGYAATRVNTQTTVYQIDSNNGRQYLGDTLASTKFVVEIRPTSAGTQGDVMIGWQGGIIAATIHGYPYIPAISATPTGSADSFGNPGAAFAYDTNKHGMWVRNTVGGQWEFLPSATTTATAGAGVAVFTNLPAGFGTTAKWWSFTGFGGAVCVVPYFTNP